MWRSLRFRRIALQAIFVVAIVAFLYALWFNLVTNMGRIGQSLDFSFLDDAAGIRIPGTAFRPSGTVLEALIIGARHTIIAAALGVFGAAVIGTLIGIGRLSTNWLVSRASAIYVEAVRNIPVLVIIFLWYFAVMLKLPRLENAFGGGPFLFSVRGITLFGFNLRIEFVALVAGLITYTSSHIAEIVRSSIQAVPRGQTEAGQALGLSAGQRLRLVVLPQARRIAMPQLANQFLNLTKNTSLGVGVAYAELMLISQQQIANRAPAPQTIAIVMAFYLVISLCIAAIVNASIRRTRWAPR